MPVSRLLEMVYILIDKRTTTAKALAEHFEVSPRTIYRDIDVLSAAGIPVYASPGKGGGISLLDDYVLAKSLLSDQEQNEVLIALQSLSATEYPDINGALSKLSSLFKKDRIGWIEVDFSSWGSSREQKERFGILQKAVLHHELVTFDYFNSSGIKSSRRIEPVKLIFKAKSWYLQGFCLAVQQYRTFKISRMANIRLTGQLFPPRSPDEQPADIEDQAFGPLVQVQLRISAEGAFRVYDEFQECQVTRQEDGSFIVTAELPDDDWLIGYMLSFGTAAEVMAPPSVRERIAERLDVLLATYKAST
ncbi:YafY family protein [Paenibacillus filicis]|uniref:YafY family protein n=1 Tax=Paenibacillus filicis TaxID=669464 RepID=A0ABU9DU63_9BACL